MVPVSREHELAEWLAAVQSHGDEIPWTKRRDMAISLGEVLGGAEHVGALRLLRQFAVDPKWEVRRAAASLLPSLSDDEFSELAAVLSDDTNGYVRQAAERALDLRRKGTRVATSRHNEFDDLIVQLDLLDGPQNRGTAEKVRKLALRYYEVSVAVTVHDLRGVLTSTRLNVQRLQTDVRQLADSLLIHDELGSIDRKLRYLEKYVDAMRNYSQAVPDAREPVRLAELVGEAHDVAFDAARTHDPLAANVTATVTVDEDVFVMVARHQMVAALANVLQNAFESVLSGLGVGNPADVSLNAVCRGAEEVHISISDNGHGLSEQSLREVRTFVPGRTTKKGYGTGFGLAITQRYIEAHGGGISIESTEGVGTTVSIVLPIESIEGGSAK